MVRTYNSMSKIGSKPEAEGVETPYYYYPYSKMPTKTDIETIISNGSCNEPGSEVAPPNLPDYTIIKKYEEKVKKLVDVPLTGGTKKKRKSSKKNKRK